MKMKMLKALAQPVRLKIVEMLLDDECCVTDVTNMLGMPQSTVSQHFDIIRNGGVLYPVKYGSKTCYKVFAQRVVGIVSILANKQ